MRAFLVAWFAGWLVVEFLNRRNIWPASIWWQLKTAPVRLLTWPFGLYYLVSDWLKERDGR